MFFYICLVFFPTIFLFPKRSAYDISFFSPDPIISVIYAKSWEYLKKSQKKWSILCFWCIIDVDKEDITMLEEHVMLQFLRKFDEYPFLVKMDGKEYLIG